MGTDKRKDPSAGEDASIDPAGSGAKQGQGDKAEG
jgi:hypothetical protein